jgi:hypothetical protein
MSAGAVAMNLSTIIVAINARLFRRGKLQRAAVSMHQGRTLSGCRGLI